MAFNVALANLLAKRGIPPVQAADATVQSLTASVVPQTALAANGNRRGASFENDADKVCYLKLGIGVSTTSFTKKLDPKNANGVGGHYEMQLPIFTGAIEAIWDTAPTGALHITELT